MSLNVRSPVSARHLEHVSLLSTRFFSMEKIYNYEKYNRLLHNE